MWKASIGAKINPNDDDGDWETDPDFINEVTEQEQRWGSKTIEGSGRTVGAIDMNKLREETTRAHELLKQKQKDDGSFGYGGKFGVEKDRMDKSAVGHDYVAKVEKHVSQTDYSTGFGGKFGVQTDRVDKSAVSWDHKENVAKHASQKDYSQGFGGKFGVDKDRQDKSAVGWDYVEKLHRHDSQTQVGKNENIITEQVQRPSQLKAKFENMAKQNEAKPIEKARVPPPQKKTFIPAQKVPEPVKTVTAVKKEEKKQEIYREEKKQDVYREEKKQELFREEKKQEVFREEKKQEIFREEKKQEVFREEKKQETFKEESRQQSYRQEIRQEVKQPPPPPQQEEPFQPPPRLMTEPILNEVNANVIVDKDEADELVDQLENESNYTAIALYDYQAAADDEISFDPDDIITNIEMIDEGWWRGTCRGVTGLFPANYVQLQDAE